MPSGTHSVELNVPIKDIWEFVSDINKWAPLVPGYVEHKINGSNQSIWELKGKIGNVEKKIQLQIDVTKWQKPNKISFNLKGINEKFDGSGSFEASVLSTSSTKITGHIKITPRGLLGSMLSPILKAAVPRKTIQLTDAVANKLIQKENEQIIIGE